MRIRKIVTTLTLLGAFVGAMCFSACNTWKGVGRDIERTGENMQGTD